MKLKNLLLGAILVVFPLLASTLVSGCSRTIVEKAPVLSGDIDNSPKEPSAWINSVKDDLIKVQIVGTKTFITFRAPNELDWYRSHINHLVSVRFECSKISKNKECDLAAAYKLYMSRGRMLVEPVKIEGPVKIN